MGLAVGGLVIAGIAHSFRSCKKSCMNVYEKNGDSAKFHECMRACTEVKNDKILKLKQKKEAVKNKIKEKLGSKKSNSKK